MIPTPKTDALRERFVAGKSDLEDALTHAEEIERENSALRSLLEKQCTALSKMFNIQRTPEESADFVTAALKDEMERMGKV